jgi:hypothetical protein
VRVVLRAPVHGLRPSRRSYGWAAAMAERTKVSWFSGGRAASNRRASSPTNRSGSLEAW